MHELTRFTYTNRDVPSFIMEAFPHCVLTQLWPVIRLLFIGHKEKDSVISQLPLEMVFNVNKYVPTWPYINQKAIHARLNRQNKSKGRKRKSM